MEQPVMPDPTYTPIKMCSDTSNHVNHQWLFGGQYFRCPGIKNISSLDKIKLSSDLGKYDDAAFDFMTKCGLEPTPDAIGQLTEVFLPCLRIMCERGYDPEGKTWRSHGWRGNLFYFLAKAGRAKQKAWIRGRYDEDSIRDAINYGGFYLRCNREDPWGEYGDPE